MAKATLEFDLDNNEDSMAFSRAHKSLDMAIVIFELTSNLKKRISYELEHRELKDWEAVHLVFERIHELINEHGINIDELTQ